MKVILRENVTGLGAPGELKDVADGYARNYLIPGRFAYRATPGAEKMVREEQRLREARANKRRQARYELAARLKEVSLTIPMTVGEGEQLYASVNPREIVAALEAQEKVALEEKAIRLEEPIRALGVYRVPVHLGAEIESTLTVWVVKDEKRQESEHP